MTDFMAGGAGTAAINTEGMTMKIRTSNHLNVRYGRRRIASVAGVVAVGLVLAGCGDDSDTPAKKAAPDPVKVSQPKPDDELTKDVGESAGAAETAGCTLGVFKEQEPEHTGVGEIERDDWNSFPPTSGKHYENWAPFGVYDEPVDDGFAVHNMEHGGVVVWYGPDVTPTMVEGIESTIDDGEKWILAPRKGLKGIASSAWTKLLTCDDDALTKLGDDGTSALIADWFDAVQSTGSPAEKDVPAYTGGMEDPKPTRDVSAESPDFG